MKDWPQSPLKQPMFLFDGFWQENLEQDEGPLSAEDIELLREAPSCAEHLWYVSGHRPPQTYWFVGFKLSKKLGLESLHL